MTAASCRRRLFKMNLFVSHCVRSGVLSASLIGLLSIAHASEDTSKPVSYKFTAGHYQLSGGDLPAATGLDLNLRATGRFGNAWLGWYGSPSQDIRQVRAGWDSSYKLGFVRFMPSLQIASGGFVGGSLSLEAGDAWFAGVGVGRTNLRNYANLNFDPNDALMLSAGYRWADNHSFALQIVRDNRLNPDQQNVHLVYRTPINDADRLTIDLLQKKGLVAGLPISRAGLSLGYDWPSYFVRVAWDPLVNFTAQDMLRLSVGTRF